MKFTKIILLLFFIFFFSACKSSNIVSQKKQNIENINGIEVIVLDENQIKDENQIAISNFNKKDEDLEKVQEYVICKYDQNCLNRYFIECKDSISMFTDESINKDFIFIVRSFSDNKCNIEILSDTEDYNSYKCEIDKNKLSFDLLEKIKKNDIRGRLNFCGLLQE